LRVGCLSYFEYIIALADGKVWMQIYVQCVYENERFTIARNVHLLVTLRSRCWQNTVNIPPSQGRREVNRS
jgi:hypothetical protein